MQLLSARGRCRAIHQWACGNDVAGREIEGRTPVSPYHIGERGPATLRLRKGVGPPSQGGKGDRAGQHDRWAEKGRQRGCAPVTHSFVFPLQERATVVPEQRANRQGISSFRVFYDYLLKVDVE